MVSKVYFTSDLHLGHDAILNFSGDTRGGSTTEEHDEWIIDSWNSKVNKRDLVWVLGDIIFGGYGTEDSPGKGRDLIKKISALNGTKKLVLGNHDSMPVDIYSQYFSKVHGIIKYKGFWLTHAPIHESELRGLKNIHGHTHDRIIDDDRYINVCVEINMLSQGNVVIDFDKIKDR